MQTALVERTGVTLHHAESTLFDHRDDGNEYEVRRRASTLFVGDLPGHARSEDLVALFSGLAPVAEAKVIGGQGFGFVTFMDPQMAADVLAVRLPLAWPDAACVFHVARC